jgi:acyl-CoA reductase-like NAD-dependent aldehyde dehydrogenase
VSTVSDKPAAEQTLEADHAELDRAIEELATGANAWAALNLTERADILTRTHGAIAEVAQLWAELAIAAKATPPNLAGEEWLSGPYASMAGFDAAAASLRKLAAGQSPLDGVPVKAAPGGRVAFQVMPATIWDRLLFSGFTAQVWMPPGTTLTEARASAGLGACHPGENGGVGLVLGAGNISSIGPLDVLYELVAFNRTSILKLNPTFASLLPAYERALEPLIDANLLRITRGGAGTGGYLAQHPGIVHVHITGSAVTHDAIVWGTGVEAQRRRAADDPLLTKPISSELGGVSPIIVVPGKWSDADIRFQAEHVATMRLHNSGHNCIGGQILVLSSDWPQREQFLAAVREVLDELPPRTPWYPGSSAKIEAAESSYPNAEHHGARLLIEVGPDTSQDLCTTEYFGPVLGHTSIAGTGAEFLNTAAAFANDKLLGTLGAHVLVAPKDRRSIGAAFDVAIAELRYGTIAINAWSAIGFFVAACPWGAFPGHTLADVGSGIGTVHNALLIDGPERTIVDGPFRPVPRSLLGGELSLSPKPPWFVTARTGTRTAELFTAFAAAPSWSKLPAIFASAMRG